MHQPAIDALRHHIPGLFDRTGCQPEDLCPNEPLPRWEMAVWLVRILDNGNPPDHPTARFADVPSDQWWRDYPSRLADLEVTKGCDTGPLRFCPHETVTRGQMATFLVRALEW